MGECGGGTREEQSGQGNHQAKATNNQAKATKRGGIATLALGASRSLGHRHNLTQQVSPLVSGFIAGIQG